MTKSKMLIWAIATAFALSLTTVGVITWAKSDHTPIEAVQSFYEHAEAGNHKEAKRYIATEVLNLYEQAGGNTWAGTISAGIKREGVKYKSIKAVSEEINGETAVVTVKVTYPDDSKTTEEMNLIKEEDGWKLTFQ